MKLLIFGVLLLVLLTTVVSAQYYDDYGYDDDYYYDYGYDTGCCCIPMFGFLVVAGGLAAYNSKQ
ncbi:hypothetical protein KAW38_03865 [Candidatus Micrarchaeota archaeon]|nr:hypothetical protein [Candidatus Micrarchaeota archaeon]